MASKPRIARLIELYVDPPVGATLRESIEAGIAEAEFQDKRFPDMTRLCVVQIYFKGQTIPVRRADDVDDIWERWKHLVPDEPR